MKKKPKTELQKQGQKNFEENYYRVINLKKKDQLESKDDVSINEAFELYMMKNFHDIKLNQLSKKMLSYWEKDFDISFLLCISLV